MQSSKARHQQLLSLIMHPTPLCHCRSRSQATSAQPNQTIPAHNCCCSSCQRLALLLYTGLGMVQALAWWQAASSRPNTVTPVLCSPCDMKKRQTEREERAAKHCTGVPAYSYQAAVSPPQCTLPQFGQRTSAAVRTAARKRRQCFQRTAWWLLQLPRSLAALPRGAGALLLRPRYQPYNGVNASSALRGPYCNCPGA